ncbi:MAG: DUF6427 family protein [Niabella sp.]
MTGVFRQKNPGNIVVLFILGFFLKLPYIFGNVAPQTTPHSGIIYTELLDFLAPFAVVFGNTYSILAFLLLLLQTFLLTRFINTQRLMSQANFLPGMAFILISSLLPEFNRLSAPLLASVPAFLVCSEMFKSHSPKFGKTNIFNVGMLLSIATLIYLPSVLFLLIAFIALIMLRPFKLNEWLVLLLGVITPYYLLAALLFITDNFNVAYLYPGFDLFNPTIPHSIWIAGALFLLLMPLLTGFYYAQKHGGRMLIHIRKTWTLFVIYLIVGLAVALLNGTAEIDDFIFALAPIAAYHGFGYFNAEWKPFPKIFFWLSVAFIIAYHILG